MRKEVFLVVGLFLFLGVVSSYFELGELTHKLDKDYFISGEKVEGWINISFEDQNSDAIFEDSEGNTANLIDLLNSDSSYIKECEPTDCEYGFKEVQNAESIEMTSGTDQKQIAGFKFDEELTSIDSVSFTIESDSPEACTNQLKGDFASDSKIDFMNTNVLEESCSQKDYGCFNFSEDSNKYGIGTLNEKHCQKVKFSASSGFYVGGWFERNDDSDIIISLYDEDFDKINGASCVIPGEIVTGEASCSVNYSVVEERELYVCVYSENGASINIKGYSDLNGCGAFDDIGEDNAAFQIFARGKKFGAFGEIFVENELSNGDKINEIFENYIYSRYGDLDCSQQDCFVPLDLMSSVNQKITIGNVTISYKTPLGTSVKSDVYELDKISAKITSDFQKLSIGGGNFSVGENYGEYDFKLSFEGDELFSEEVLIESAPVLRRIYPTTAAIFVPTQFEIFVTTSQNVTSYEWTFEDNKTVETKTNKASYTYSNTGNNTVKVKIFYGGGKEISEEFNIVVRTPQEQASYEIESKKAGLSNVNAQIGAFDNFSQEAIEKIFDLDSYEVALSQAEDDYEAANGNSDYEKIVENLAEVKIPENIRISFKSEGITFFPKEYYIDLYSLSEITSQEFDVEKEDSYREAILSWNQQNIQTKIASKKYVASYDGKEYPLTSVFTVYTNAISEFEETPYIIIENIEGLYFGLGETFSDEGIYSYDQVVGGDVINFATTEDIDFTNIPMFISPGIEELNLVNIVPQEDDNTKWVFFVLVILFLMIVSLIVYAVLAQWYKHKYERHLFKNRNNLLNLVNYINTQRRKGVKDSEIEKNLRKAKWNSEQINYAMRKYAGKRTGMIELPFLKIFSKKKETNYHRVPKNFGPRRDVFRRKKF